METKLGYIAEYAVKHPEAKFTSLMHMVSKETMETEFKHIGRNKAEGIDEVSWQEYARSLEANIEGLLERMKKMEYKPQAARRVYIPKDNGQFRPLGIPAIEDKIVQKCMSRIMGAIYEQDFYECSYGFRPGRSCHQALKVVGELINNEPINHVIEADIKGFFDNVLHSKLMELLRIRINDERFLRYITRFLKAGYVDNGVLVETLRGTPQGGNLSPLLANIFLHYALDEWFEKEVKSLMKGQCCLVRYCDDFVILAQYKTEAEEILSRLKTRLSEYGLELHPDKTSIKSFGRYEEENANRQQRRANTFDFLGITHYCGRSRRGTFKVCRRTSKKRFRKACCMLKEWLKLVIHSDIKLWWKTLAAKIGGHYQYYGVSENSASINQFRYIVERILYKYLNKRSQKKSFNWEGFKEYLRRFPLPKPYIVHSFYKPICVAGETC